MFSILMLVVIHSAQKPKRRQLIMVHYMPWFQSKSVSGKWGWHWTMNHFNPEKLDNQGRQELASQYRPIIGAYDSSDPAVLRCQTEQMKLAGIDGVFIDWYGTQNLYDYALINKNTNAIIEACTQAGLKFSIVLEDQIVPQLVKNGICTPDTYGESALKYMESKWFQLPGYLKWHGKPVLLMFGPQYYKSSQLRSIFGQKVALFTLLSRRSPAVGAFGWPEPQVGNKKSWFQLKQFYKRAKKWPTLIAPAYPRFDDIYKQANVGPGYGTIRDNNGKTFSSTLQLAYRSNAPFIQIATWNDWGEGTQIEPSIEFGYRDLITLQTFRRKHDPHFFYNEKDLPLPAELYKDTKNNAPPKFIKKVARDLSDGKCSTAARLLHNFSPQIKRK